MKITFELEAKNWKEMKVKLSSLIKEIRKLLSRG